MWTVFSTIKYGQNPINGIDDIIKKPPGNILSQNYPNSFSNTTTIEYILPKKAFVSLKIYNATGQLVTTLVDEQKPEV